MKSVCFFSFSVIIKVTWNEADYAICEPVQVGYYKPEEEGTDQGFDDYGVYIVPLNGKGKGEIDGIVAALKESSLFDDIGAIRYNAKGGVIPIDYDDFNDFNKFSTENALAYVFSKTDDSVNSYDKVVFCRDAENKRYVVPINTSALSSAV